MNMLMLVGFGHACAPVRCAHPSFWSQNCLAQPLRAPPPIAASLLLIHPPKINKIYRTLSPAPPHCSFADPSSNIVGSKLCTGVTIGPNCFRFSPFYIVFFFIFSLCYSLLILLSFLNFFLLIYSYSCLLIGSYSSYSSRTILRLLIFLFLYFNLFIVLRSYKLCTGATIRPYFCVLSFFIVFELLFLLFSSYSSLLFNFYLFISSYSSLHMSSYSSLLIFKLFVVLQTCICTRRP
jgi:hypothetical protein